MKPLEHPSLYTVYCDDFREETGGKATIVGWYPTDPIMLPLEGPLILPTLCIIGVLTLPLDLELLKVKVEILENDKVLHSLHLSPQNLLEMQKNGLNSPGPLRGLQARIVLKLSNVQITETCMFHQRITVNEEVLTGHALRFMRNSLKREA